MAEEKRHKLHHSYIWLQTLRTAPAVFLVVVISIAPNLAQLVDAFSSGYTAIASLMGLLVFGATLVICGIVMAVLAVQYRFRWYEFDPLEFGFYSGVLSKKRMHIPYQRVQSVNEKMSLLQRIVGVCTVTIDTAGGASNTALSVAYVERSAAERIRRELFMRKELLSQGMSPEEVETYLQSKTAQAIVAGDVPLDATKGAVSGAPVPPWELQAQHAVRQEQRVQQQNQVHGSNILDTPTFLVDDVRGIFGKDALETGAITCEYGLTNKELILTALSSKTSFALILIGVVSALAGLVSSFVDLGLVPDEETVYTATWVVMSDVASHLGLLLVIPILFLLLVLWAISFIGSCLSYAGFRARRRGERVEVERGLITHVFTGIDVDRIQFVSIHQTFLQRLLKCCSVSYGRVSAEEQEMESSSSTATERLIVHPFLPLSKATELVESLTPEYANLPKPTVRVAPKALRRALTRHVILQGAGFWLAVITLLTWAALAFFGSEVFSEEPLTGLTFGWLVQISAISLLVLAAIIALFELVGAVLWYRSASCGWDHGALTIVNGGYSIDRVSVPRPKVQFATLRTNPLQRFAKLATIDVKTAAGTSGKRQRLIDVTATDAEAWLEWARPHVLASQEKQVPQEQQASQEKQVVQEKQTSQEKQFCDE